MKLIKTYAFNNPTTVSDAQKLLEDAWHSYFPSDNIEIVPYWLTAYQGETKHSYTLMPTWVAEGELFPDAKAEDEAGEKQYDTIPHYWENVLVNAQTAELINPWNKKSDRSFDKPQLITWEGR